MAEQGQQVASTQRQPQKTAEDPSIASIMGQSAAGRGIVEI